MYVIQRRLGKDSNQTLFWHSDQKISQWKQRWTLCTVPAQSFITQLTSSCLYCSVTFHHTHTLTELLPLSHTNIIQPFALDSSSLVKHTLVIQLFVKYTFILLQNALPLSLTLTHTHWAPCLSEAVAVGLWSSEARMVGTVAVLEQDREREVTALYSTRSLDVQWLHYYVFLVMMMWLQIS